MTNKRKASQMTSNAFRSKKQSKSKTKTDMKKTKIMKDKKSKINLKKAVNKLKRNSSKIDESMKHNKSRKIDKELSKIKENFASNKIGDKKLSTSSNDLEAKKNLSLKEKLQLQLQSATFRIINEDLYTTSSSEAFDKFKDHPEAFEAYHEGYSAQIKQWPVNPSSLIIKWLKKKPITWKVADMGCGDAIISKSAKQSVQSIDLVAKAPNVIECDMAHTPLASSSVDVVIFCLSLMGTNITDFILEANRILVDGGVMKIAEVESRFTNVDQFLKSMFKLGFTTVTRKQDHEYFWLFDFKKVKNVKLTVNPPPLCLQPCLYKKR